MTEQELIIAFDRLVQIFRNPSPANELEAQQIIVKIAASTVACLHRIADAMEQ